MKKHIALAAGLALSLSPAMAKGGGHAAGHAASHSVSHAETVTHTETSSGTITTVTKPAAPAKVSARSAKGHLPSKASAAKKVEAKKAEAAKKATSEIPSDQENVHETKPAAPETLKVDTKSATKNSAAAGAVSTDLTTRHHVAPKHVTGKKCQNPDSKGKCPPPSNPEDEIF